jgi:hypothetical protein
MNAPAELTALREFLWNYLQDATLREQTFSAVKSLLGDFALAVGLSFAIASVLCFAAALLYQPRIPRGALWVPAFGIFGHTPKFYCHTRPASICGIFLKYRHRLPGVRKRAKAH